MGKYVISEEPLIYKGTPHPHNPQASHPQTEALIFKASFSQLSSSIHDRIYVVPRPPDFVHQYLALSVGIDTKSYVGSLSFFHLTTVSSVNEMLSLSSFNLSNDMLSSANALALPLRMLSESETVTHLLTHIKILIRRRTIAIAALDAGLYSEAIHHFSKIVDGRRGAPQGFLAECYMQRTSAFRAAGRIAYMTWST
ncbi:hypothetical protein ACFX13_030365 [Malus domestica]